jgi:hypothetical protein
MKNLVAYMLHLILAVFGTAVFESAARATIQPALSRITISEQGLLKLILEWCLSIACAASIGFATARYWRSNRMGAFIWSLPVGIFLLRILVFVVAPHRESVFEVHADNIWSHFSGAGCYTRTVPTSCTDFILFTLVACRSISYSLASLGAQASEHSTSRRS